MASLTFHVSPVPFQILNNNWSPVFWMSWGNISDDLDHIHPSSSTLLATGEYVQRLPGWVCSWWSIVWICFHFPFQERVSNMLILDVNYFLLLWQKTKIRGSSLRKSFIVFLAYKRKATMAERWQQAAWAGSWESTSATTAESRESGPEVGWEWKCSKPALSDVFHPASLQDLKVPWPCNTSWRPSFQTWTDGGWYISHSNHHNRSLARYVGHSQSEQDVYYPLTREASRNAEYLGSLSTHQETKEFRLPTPTHSGMDTFLLHYIAKEMAKNLLG